MLKKAKVFCFVDEVLAHTWSTKIHHKEMELQQNRIVPLTREAFYILLSSQLVQDSLMVRAFLIPLIQTIFGLMEYFLNSPAEWRFFYT